MPRAIDGHVTWCAQREPTLNEDSPRHLPEAIIEAEATHRSGEWLP